MSSTAAAPSMNSGRKTAPASRSPRIRAKAVFAAIAIALVTAVSVLGGVVPNASAQPGETTSTLPTDNRQLGNSLPKPNQGMEPQDAGDPGGWLQVSLFFLICAAILLIAAAVWWQSRRARQRRDAAGYDPMAVARASGKGVRAGSGDAS